VEELHAGMTKPGLEVGRLEAEGWLCFVEARPEADPAVALRRVYDEEVGSGGHTLWASFDWTTDVDLEEAVRHQRELTRFVADRHAVVQTGVLEGAPTSGRPPWDARLSWLTRRPCGSLKPVWLQPGRAAGGRCLATL
jgi:hypothetical protein